jgi:hypothetical protein
VHSKEGTFFSINGTIFKVSISSAREPKRRSQKPISLMKGEKNKSIPPKKGLLLIVGRTQVNADRSYGML